MKASRGRFGRSALIVLGLVAIAVGLAVCAYLFLVSRNREQTRRQFEPPIVTITDPTTGASLPNGGTLAVSACAMGLTPIRSVELWLDGVSLDKRTSDGAEGLSPFFVIFDVPISQGPHTIIVRAVNTRGVIGLSLPLEVLGKEGAGQPFQPVLVSAGQTLADIAASNGVNLEAVQQLNPALNGADPPAGSFVKLPKADSSHPGNPIPLPDTPPLEVIQPAPLQVVAGWLNPLLQKPPAAPANLLVQVKDCKVTLAWNDQADNEGSYEIWFSGGDSLPQKLYTLAPANGGQVWFEFPAPQPGFLTLWVKAVNALGQQPSDPVAVYIESACPSSAPVQLIIQLIELHSTASFNQAYCYVSLEGAPYQRLPSEASSFFQFTNGQVDLAALPVSERQYVLAIPTDGALDLSGECWGWNGTALNKIGDAQASFPVDTWDGSPQTISVGNLSLVFTLQLSGGADGSATKTTYANNDPGLPIPYNLRLEESGTDLLGDIQQWLLWDWDGDPKAIDGYMVYLNGMPYKMINDPGDKAIWSLLPYGCGQHVRWEVAAVTGQGQSTLSAPLEYDLPTCALLAVIQFETITVQGVYNSASLLPGMGWGACDTIGASFGIYVNNYHQLAGRWYADLFSGPGDYPLTCGYYTFDQLFRYFPKYQNAAQPDTVRVMLKGENPSLTFATRFMYWNKWGEPTNFAMANQTISMPYEQWKSYKNSFGRRTTSGEVEAYVKINVWTETNK